MDFSLTAQQCQLREKMTRFAKTKLNDSILGRDRHQIFPDKLWLKLGQVRLPGMLVSKKYGGLGFDAITAAVALESLGYGCRDSGLVFSLCAHLLACVVPVLKHGNEAQKKAYLPKLSNGKIKAVNAMTEEGNGSDVFTMSTSATSVDRGFLLNGRKMFISNAPHGDLFLVYAVTDSSKKAHGGITAFLIARDTPGLKIGKKMDKMGLRTCPMSGVELHDVRVPSSAVLGKVGGGSAIFSQSMDWERTLIAAAHVGVIERVLEEVIGYARSRQVFGQKIGKLQGVAHPITDIKVKLEAARLLVHKAAWNLERGRTSGLDASIAKLFVSESLVESGLQAVQILGARGYLARYDLERVLRDSVASTIYSGTSNIQKNIIAGWLGL